MKDIHIFPTSRESKELQKPIHIVIFNAALSLRGRGLGTVLAQKKKMTISVSGLVIDDFGRICYLVFIK